LLLRRLHALSITALVAVLATLATGFVIALPQLRFAYAAPSVRAAVETGAAVIALVASYLVLGRFFRGRRLDDLMLAVALGTLSCSNLLSASLLAVSHFGIGRTIANGGNLAGAILIAVAAFAPPVPLARRRHLSLFVLGMAAVVVASAVGTLLLLDHFFASTPVFFDQDPGRPHLETRVYLIVAQSLSLGAFLLAAIGFARRAETDRDSFLAFVSAGTVLAAFARLHYLLFAPGQPGWIRTGDIFRAAFYAVLLIGAGREIEQYWRGLAQTAVLEERRRIARDLHDGVAQELAFIGRRARRLASKTGLDAAREIAASAERALGDSRRAIAALTKPLDQPLADVLTEAVEEVAARHEIRLDLAIEPGVEVDADAREALVRIACEAVSNAARHGGADVVRVELSNSGGVRFAVSDLGRGFDPDRPTPARFGLTIMRERAQAVGGSFRLRSSPGTGTEVEVTLP
jgi:signal transduction histidine kinase